MTIVPCRDLVPPSFLLHSASQPQFLVATLFLLSALQFRVGTSFPCCIVCRDLSFRSRPHFWFYCLNSRSRLPFSSCDLDFLLLNTSLGRDLNDWSRPPLRSLTNKVVAASIFLQGLRLWISFMLQPQTPCCDFQSSFMSRPEQHVATSN